MSLFAVSILSALCPQEFLTSIAIGTSLAVFEILLFAFQPTESTQ